MPELRSQIRDIYHKSTRENMVTGGESETWVRVDAHQPPPGTSDFPDDNLPSNPCNNLASRDSFSNISLAFNTAG